ncbi:hypothetical protein [Bacillus sp. FJAT-27264]|nr:hypothetical protein [Bacillus sp. FJAT-27264]
MRLLFEEEYMIALIQPSNSNYFPRSKQHKVPTYGKYEGAKLSGAINY